MLLDYFIDYISFRDGIAICPTLLIYFFGKSRHRRCGTEQLNISQNKPCRFAGDKPVSSSKGKGK